MTKISAEPYDIDIDLDRTALIIIDMQRDFVEPGGFGEALGNDTSPLQAVIPPTKLVLEAAREAGMLVVHTREGHRADLTDLWSAKHGRGEGDDVLRIGDPGPMGRLLVRGQHGHGIVDELAPHDGEPIIDKPGKGSFYATDLEVILRRHDIATLIVCGVTTEVCVHTTVREANDRGFQAVVLSDCVGSYFPEFQRVGLDMIKAQGGIFGWVAPSASFLSIAKK